MKRNRLALLLISLVIPACGCVTACGPFDYEYNCYGGTFDRVDRVYGRAGSLSAPAQAVDPSQHSMGNTTLRSGGGRGITATRRGTRSVEQFDHINHCE